MLACAIVGGGVGLGLFSNWNEEKEPKDEPPRRSTQLAECYGETLELELITDFNEGKFETVLEMSVPTHQGLAVERFGTAGYLQDHPCGLEPIVTRGFWGPALPKLALTESASQPRIGAILHRFKVRGGRFSDTKEPFGFLDTLNTTPRADGFRYLSAGAGKGFGGFWVYPDGYTAPGERPVFANCRASFAVGCNVQMTMAEYPVAISYEFHMTGNDSRNGMMRKTAKRLPDFIEIDKAVRSEFSKMVVAKRPYRGRLN